MSCADKTYVPYKGSALPGNAEVIVLFSSVTAFGLDAAPHYQIYWVDVSIFVDAGTTNTVELQKSADGTTWKQVATTTVPNTGDGSTEASFYVAPHKNFRIVYTNGATPQTAFTCDVALDSDSRAANA